MCGRFSQTAQPANVSAVFDVRLPPKLPEGRYNIAPTQPIAVVRLNAQGERELVTMRWGFRHTPKEGGTRLIINARQESVATKPMFAQAFASRRCLVVADGFYEWRQEPGGKKTPMYIRPQSGLVGLLALWRYEGSDAACCIVTVDANQVVLPIHNRMPAMLLPAQFDTWLQPTTPAAVLNELMQTPNVPLHAYAVSTQVNDAINDGPGLIQPVAAQMRLF